MFNSLRDELKVWVARVITQWVKHLPCTQLHLIRFPEPQMVPLDTHQAYFLKHRDGRKPLASSGVAPKLKK